LLALRNSEQRMNQHKEKKQEGNKESREKVATAGLILLLRVALSSSFYLFSNVWDYACRLIGLDLSLQPLLLMTMQNS